MSLHINNNNATKRGIGKKLLLTIRAVMLDELVDLVAGDFRAAWRRDKNNNISIIKEAFADSDLPVPPGPTPLSCAGYLGLRMRVSQAPRFI